VKQRNGTVHTTSSTVLVGATLFTYLHKQTTTSAGATFDQRTSDTQTSEPSTVAHMSLQYLRRWHSPRFQSFRVLMAPPAYTGFRLQSSKAETDSLGIPTHPTWSVDKLLSSYAKPVIAPSTLKHLHDLSALIPPDEGTEEHVRLTSEMENLVKLVEAVKFIEVNTDPHEIPDGRIWAEGVGIDLSENAVGDEKDDISGRELLRYAQRTSPDGLYVVDSDKSR